MSANPVVFSILIVEDQMADAYLARLAFAESVLPRDLRCELHHVQDGQEALDFLLRRTPYEQAPRPDLILLDLNMPRMDGRAFLRHVKKLESLRRIPVVILTTSNSEGDIQDSYDLGAAGFIVKPLDMEQFTRKVQGLQDYWVNLVQRPAP